MRVLVVGASGGSGRAAVEALLERGHEVTAFARRVDRLGPARDRLVLVRGDATDAEQVDRVVRGQDAVVVTLGISENALRVRLLGSAGTPMDVRSRGTRTVIAAMRRHGVRRLVVQTSYGVGETRALPPWWQRLVFWLVLRPQIEDTERQDREVHASGLDWVLAQPVNLTDAEESRPPFASTVRRDRRHEGRAHLGGPVPRRGGGRRRLRRSDGCALRGRTRPRRSGPRLGPTIGPPAHRVRGSFGRHVPAQHGEAAVEQPRHVHL